MDGVLAMKKKIKLGFADKWGGFAPEEGLSFT